MVSIYSDETQGTIDAARLSTRTLVTRSSTNSPATPSPAPQGGRPDRLFWIAHHSDDWLSKWSRALVAPTLGRRRIFVAGNV